MALAVAFRNLVGSLVVIGLAVATLGMAIGAFYRQVPVVKRGLGTLPIAPFAKAGAAAPPYPEVPWPVTLGVGFVAGLAVVLYVVQLFWTAMAGKRPLHLARLAVAMTWAAVLIVGIGVVVPAFVWVSSWLTYHIGFTSHPGVVVGSVSVMVSFIGALAATLWRNKQRVTSALSAGRRLSRACCPTA